VPGATTLPADLNSFVGRRRELSRLKRSLASSRIVTVTGVGGVGKTRLALQLARQLARGFPDGVYLVALDQLNDPELVDAAVAGVLGLRVPADGLPRQALRDNGCGPGSRCSPVVSRPMRFARCAPTS
jgi:serine/threonine-protein kinase PknK